MSRPLVAESETEQQVPSELWGKHLRDIRKSREMGLEEVAAELRLDIKLLRQIENEDLEQLPSAPFVKGYLRSYARLLNVDPVPIVEAYGQVCGPDAPGLADMARSSGRRRELTSKDTAARSTTWVIVGTVVISILLWWWSQMLSYKKSVQEVAVSEAVPEATSPEALPEPQDVVIREGSNGEAVIELVLPEQLQQQEQLPPATTATESAAAETSVTPAPSPDTITLKFSGDSWVDITDATGASLLVDMGKANTARTVTGQPPFKVMLGNAPAVTIEHNGVPYDLKANAKNGIARFTLGVE